MATPKIKHKIAYTGKGKKNPRLPVGQHGVLTVVQGADTFDLPVTRGQGGILFELKTLTTNLGLKPAQIKHLPIVEIAVEGVKKPVPYLNVGSAVLAAATARSSVGQQPLTTFFLGAALQGIADRLVAVVPEFADEPAVEQVGQ